MGMSAPTLGQKAIIEFSRRLGFGNGAIRKYGGRLVRRLGGEKVVYRYHGLNLILDPLTGSSRIMLMTPYWYDAKERDFIRQRLSNGGVFVDIGANSGFYSFFVAAHCRAARIFAFEPMPHHAALLRENVALNDLEDRVTVMEMGLCEREGVTDIDGHAVACNTLLNAVQQQKLTSIECLKIDIEGMEDSVLLPFFRDAPRSLWPKAIVGEHIFTDQWRDLCLSLGYSQHLRTQYNIALTLD
ncbi:hypothetical protein C6Y62_05225 [Hyphomicrobium sulfonivorans]|nr:hypothetical protein [Hyphomicrobium sulfonivorans]